MNALCDPAATTITLKELFGSIPSMAKPPSRALATQCHHQSVRTGGLVVVDVADLVDVAGTGGLLPPNSLKIWPPMPL